MSEVVSVDAGEEKKKENRKAKNNNKECVINKDQTRFFIDISKEKKSKDKVFDLLEKANKKDRGDEVTFKDLALFAIEKLTSKDIEKLQERSLSKMEKVEIAKDEYNQRNGTKLSLEEYLVKKLNIN